MAALDCWPPTVCLLLVESWGKAGICTHQSPQVLKQKVPAGLVSLLRVAPYGWLRSLADEEQESSPTWVPWRLPTCMRANVCRSGMSLYVTEDYSLAGFPKS